MSVYLSRYLFQTINSPLIQCCYSFSNNQRTYHQCQFWLPLNAFLNSFHLIKLRTNDKRNVYLKHWHIDSFITYICQKLFTHQSLDLFYSKFPPRNFKMYSFVTCKHCTINIVKTTQIACFQFEKIKMWGQWSNWHIYLSYSLNDNIIFKIFLNISCVRHLKICTS